MALRFLSTQLCGKTCILHLIWLSTKGIMMMIHKQCTIKPITLAVFLLWDWDITIYWRVRKSFHSSHLYITSSQMAVSLLPSWHIHLSKFVLPLFTCCSISPILCGHQVLEALQASPGNVDGDGKSSERDRKLGLRPIYHDALLCSSGSKVNLPLHIFCYASSEVLFFITCALKLSPHTSMTSTATV